MRDLGTPVLPRPFFERLYPAFGELVVFGAVYWRGQPVAAGGGFRWHDEFELTWASSLREHNRMAPHRFKRQSGGLDVPLPWAQWTGRDETATPSPDRPLLWAATAVWRRLPLIMTNRMGPILARRLP
jgi:hypothetical protein